MSWRTYALPAAFLAAGSLIVTPEPAEARRQSHNTHYRHAVRAPIQIPHETQKAHEENKPAGPLYAVVSLADQHVSFYDANGLWARSQVSTGVPGHPTPTGVFTILEKERWHRSNIYSGAPMPYMQRLAWTGVAMHEGVVPNYPASHGCIRLPGSFAKMLFGFTTAGQRVIISPEDVTPSNIAHAHLPAPQLLAPPEPAGAKTLASTAGRPLATVALEKQAAAGEAKLLNPVEFAQALKSAAAAKAASALKAKKEAFALLAVKSVEARQAAYKFAVAEEALRKARQELEYANRAVAGAQGDEAVKRANERKAVAEDKVAAAETQLRESHDAKDAKDQDAASERNAIRDAEAQEVDAAANAKDAVLRAEPVSIFISRKTRRLYVRQATQHLLDVPIAIRDPGRPLGTHLFIATRAGDDGASVRWVKLTPPAAVEVKLRRHSSRRGHKIEPEREAPLDAPFPETASAALDRIEIPAEAAQLIGERLWTGATLIISDVGMSGEGRYAMDFMILGRTPVRED